MKHVIDRVWEYSLKNPEGFTLNIETFKPVKFGIVAAFLETQDSFGRTGLTRAVQHALKHSKIVGGWLNYDNGLYYFDSSRIFKNSELEQAIEFARQNNQLAIFDLTNLKEIRIR